MSVLKMFGFDDLKSLKSRLAQVSPEQLSSPVQKKQLKRLQAKQGGFSLLELLVVVAIMAAIASGTAIMINSADKNAKAAVHAAAADSLFKSIATFKVLNNVYPDSFDSLASSAAGADLTDAVASTLLSTPLAAMFTFTAATNAHVASLNAVGITKVQVINDLITPANCAPANVKAYLNVKANKVLVSNIFQTGTGDGAAGTTPGCGKSITIATATGTELLAKLSAASVARVNGVTGNSLYAFGVGKSSTLFDATKSGALSRPAHYSNLKIDQYNHFIAIFDATPTEASLAAVVTPKGETFEDELAIWEGAA